MFVHKNSQIQANTPSILARSEYVKPRQTDSKESPPISAGEGNSEQNSTSNNSDDVCFTSYSSFTVKPRDIKPMDLRSLQAYSVPTTPEKKLFSSLNVSTLVSPVTSLFNSERKVEGSKHSEVDTIRGPRYDAMGIHGAISIQKESDAISRKSFDFPRPSIDAILASFQQHDSEEAREQSSGSDEDQFELLTSAMSAAETFQILELNEYRLLNQDYLEHSISIDTLKTKLEQELKFREGASSMVNVQTDKKLLQQAQEELASSERKVNQFSSELWRMTQSANLLEKKRLEHVAGVLARSIRQGVGSSKTTISMSSQKDLPPEISMNDLSNMCTQLNEMSHKLNAFVKSQSSTTISSVERDNEALRESLNQALLEKERYKRELGQLKETKMSSQDLSALSEEEKDQMIQRLRQTVDEYLLDISHLNEEKAEMLENLKYIYLRLPDLSLSRESSISSKTSDNCEFDGKKFTDRIDRLIQENHRLMDRVVKLQHKSQFAKVDRRGAISPKDRSQGIYSNRINSNPRIWLEEFSSGEEDDSIIDQESSINSLGASLENQSL